MTAPTGDQYELTRGGVTAVITQVAAALRELRVDGVDVIEPYDADVAPPFGAGSVLAPWPNRVADGAWELDGAPQQLVITEPTRGNALHGLLRWTAYSVVERSDEAITLEATVYPQPGWPFLVETSVRYELTDDGIRVTHAATNRSGVEAPFAVGTHPFFRIGDAPAEQLVLTVKAGTRFDVDERLNPVGEVAVADRYDLTQGRAVGTLDLDTAFGQVTSDDDGAVAWLEASDGRRVALLQDPEEWPWVQVFTTRLFPRRDGRGLAVAIEPMTAPPDALNSGVGLRWLRPGEAWTGSWGVRYTT